MNDLDDYFTAAPLVFAPSAAISGESTLFPSSARVFEVAGQTVRVHRRVDRELAIRKFHRLGGKVLLSIQGTWPVAVIGQTKATDLLMRLKDQDDAQVFSLTTGDRRPSHFGWLIETGHD